MISTKVRFVPVLAEELENINKLKETGLKGFVVLGSNGEAAFLSKEEKLGLVKAAKESLLPEQLLIAGTFVSYLVGCRYHF